ncbi:hypothetical protein BOTNAR_0200g00190 [Botryotinia narcissicola]|uniref:Uncharacterized protein n=1 Tax=Botryotinia narcissicola TaxID=278944 RepID=A0A4Z1ID48_9HELO|nr:hypothetical protein BOTNAR_0200g00190 [Botryotinia narcissicola]
MTRKYGKKRPAASAAAVAIFGSTTQSVAPVKTNTTTTSKSQSPQRDLAEITNLLENTTLLESTDEVTVLLEKASLESRVNSLNNPLDLENIGQDSSSKDAPSLSDETTVDSTIEAIVSLEETLAPIEPKIEVSIPHIPVSISPTPLPINPRLTASLSPLLAAYEKDNGYPLATKNWDDVLAPGSSIQKIAEASYAEVFRITNPVGSSILKLLRLKVPTDPTSKKSDTAIKVETVVSEMRLMNALTEIPGFVKFKDAHIVEGKPPAAFVTAYEGHLDAGVVVALARAEIEHEFEHRDLHENNICILERTPPQAAPKPNSKSPHKFGNSGLEITILVYGLSRATIYPVCSSSNPSPAPETVFYNLESDTVVFSSFEPSTIAGVQFDTYRRMRAYLFSGGASNTNSNTPLKAIRDAIKQKKHSWEEYMPYSNVLWLYFLMEYLTEVAPKGGRGKPGNPDWVPGNGASDGKGEDEGEGEEEEELGLGCAGDVLQYAFDMGWVCEEDLGDADTSRLSLREDSYVGLEKKKKHPSPLK